MEEGVWVLIGVISVIIGVGIIASLLINSEQDLGAVSVGSALDQLANQCNMVCRLPQDSASSTRVDLREGVFLYTQEDLLCAQIDNETSCRRCNCDFGEFTEQLNLSQALSARQSYSCRFTKTGHRSIDMECQG